MAVDLYGAGLPDVEALLPGRPPFGPTTKPTAVQAAGFVEQAAGWVATRVGPLTDGRIADVDLSSPSGDTNVSLGSVAVADTTGVSFTV